ncbi:MAG: DMT family transporter [Planctomycetes bacterium]|nr:DMT family transporter [Planctomycetota bacterium]
MPREFASGSALRARRVPSRRRPRTRTATGTHTARSPTRFLPTASSGSKSSTRTARNRWYPSTSRNSGHEARTLSDVRTTHGKRGVVYAITAAVLFGASTPAAKALLGSVPAILLAGLLYLGSGAGLGLWSFVSARRGGKTKEARLARRDVPWLVGVVLVGGVAGPVLLMWGLAKTSAAAAALLLNLEGVLTALLAWFVFRENFDRRIALGMAAIVAGGVSLSWGGTPEIGVPWGALAIAGACLCWALDNNLTRKISAADPVQIAAIKGFGAGVTNTILAFLLGASMPVWNTLTLAMLLGLASYGVSLVLFILGLRHLGSARTGAYFSTAPFVGAALSIAALGERPTLLFFAAAVLMGIGLWLHLTERHEHQHEHGYLEHEHWHEHDEHHQHEHLPGIDPRGPHSHPHVHPPTCHTHAHFPDIHHQHDH